MNERTYIKDLHEKIGGEVRLSAWVDIRRDHGKLIFVDFRDVTGKVQAVILPNHAEAHSAADKIRPEWVVETIGKVNKRPEKMINGDEPNGDIEIEVTAITVLNESKTPPFDISSDGRDISEDVRLKYRYLDLRRPRLQKNIKSRHEIISFIRTFLSDRNFTEIETPILTKSTPEGARDYVVPARLYPGKFYALPQAPQQFKQLLMVSGFERYFQIARCFRDEDTRGDRQPEFTQLDLEMSFVEREDVIKLNEELLIGITQKLFPEKRIQEIPFQRLSYKEAMEKYGTDRPDLRADKNDPNLLAFVWIVDFPFFEKTDDGKWTFTHNPFSAAIPEHSSWLENKEKIGEIITSQYDVALNGFEIGGGSIRSHRPGHLRKVFEIIGYDDASIEENFGHMLEALSYGAPPHGGIAWGLDRLVTILQGEPNIREVIAFPKTGEGRDLMMDAPSELKPEQLQELSIKVTSRENK